MKFLIDQNLPVRLVDIISAFDHEVAHVKLIGMAAAGDAKIWALAGSQGMIVVSKDKDFLTLAQRSPSGQQLVRLDLGNCSNDALYDIVRRDWSMVATRLKQGETGLEIRA
ncbi:DUF5615 family PIN-like protein [Brevundimonas sp.]|uniref:DUF5615 family PIN-like protein n=1 Tax=Brevundimonas sp. TaxID=1871086 RepID=UPI0037C05503